VFQHPKHRAGYGNAIAGAVVARRRRFSEVQSAALHGCSINSLLLLLLLLQCPAGGSDACIESQQH